MEANQSEWRPNVGPNENKIRTVTGTQERKIKKKFITIE